VLRQSVPAAPPGDRTAGDRKAGDKAAGARSASPPVAPGEAASVRAQGPRVRRSLVSVQVARIAADMFAHALRDESGAAAREVADAGELPGLEPAAATLAAEFRAWASQPVGAPDVREWVMARWNGVGDSGYRGYVSRLLDREDIPAHGDHVRVVTDCLARLGRDARATGH
jgi:hypothetical protein